MKSNTKISIAILVLVITHVVGFWGMQMSEFTNNFLQLTPYQLIITTIIVFSFHQDWNWKFILVIPIIGILGFGAEWLGVHTGKVFGEYSYGKTLGWKWDEIPYMIGVNWILLIYCTGNIIAKLEANNWIKAILGAFLMITLDYYIEPVAIKFDFWHWHNELGAIPIQNYVAWYIISFFLLMLYLQVASKKLNVVAVSGFFIQLGFFMAFTIFKN